MAVFLRVAELVSAAVLVLGLSAIIYFQRHRMPELLRTINRWIHTVMLFLAEIALASMVLIVIMTVILRFFFRTGIGWAEEVPRLMVGYFAFFACAMGVRDHTHISMDVFYNLAPKGGKIRAFMDFFVNVCILLCGAFLLYYGGDRIMRMMRLSGVLPMTGWPNWVRYAAAPIVGFTIIFDSILYLTRVLKRNDLLFSEPDVDYMSQVTHEKKGGKK